MMKRWFLALTLIALAACSATEQSGSSAALGSPPSGFLGDYSQLKPRNKDHTLLVGISPNERFVQYTSIQIEPVQFWGDPDSKLDHQDQQKLCDYYYGVLKQYLATQATIVDHPGPGVITLRAALTDAATGTPGLRTISAVVPQARLLGSVKNLAAGTYAFVGSAQSEMEAFDSVTQQRLVAAVDQRSGGLSIRDAEVWEWGDAAHAMDYWAEQITERFVELRSGQTISALPDPGTPRRAWGIVNLMVAGERRPEPRDGTGT
jgi:hypothetical protein